jgi:hypothetical protein
LVLGVGVVDLDPVQVQEQGLVQEQGQGLVQGLVQVE